MAFKDKLKTFSVDLFEVNAVKFGEFKTKVGLNTPVYCDLRVIVSYPKLMQTLSTLITEYININNFNVICGVPYTALPIATAISLKTSVPMVMRRKEAKDYGTKKLIEGVYKAGDKCLLVEDVVTSGSSVLETVKDLKEAGLKCEDVVVLLNREQGGAKILEQNGIKMHALLSLREFMAILREAGCVDDATVEKVQQYLATTQVSVNDLQKPLLNRLKMSLLSRAKLATNPIAEELFQIMSAKQTSLCVAADVTTSTELLNLAEQVGPHICLLKTHIDIMEDFHANLLKHLKEIAERHNFVLFEDRKFADIGKTVELQYSKGIYKISSWAKVVTAHSVMGKGILDAIKGSCGLDKRGVFLLAEASSQGSLIDEKYVKASLKLAGSFPELITGVVCQSPLFLENPGLIQLTPGVQLESKCDDLGQQYKSPKTVVLQNGADIAVVGRGVTKAANPGEAAQKYKKILWDALVERIES